MNFVYSVAIVAAGLGFVCGDLRALSPAGPALLSGVAWKLLAVLAIVLSIRAMVVRRFYVGSKTAGAALEFQPIIALLGFLLLLCSDYMTRRFIFYPTQLARLDLLLIGVLCLGVLLFRSPVDLLSLPRQLFRPLFLCSIQICVFLVFLGYANGRLIWSDDHPSFLYRLHLLSHNFPWLPFYNVDWNAGYNAREFFPSGVLNVFALTFPLAQSLADATTTNQAAVFTVLVGFLFVFVCPWATYFAALILNNRRDVATVAGLFSLAPTMSYFEWMLKYGTLGFATATALLPLTFALAWKVALSDRPGSWTEVLLLVIVSSLTLMWSLSFLALIPITCVALLNFRRVFAKQRRNFVLGFAVLLLLVNIPWILTFVRESRVVEFVGGSTLPGSHTRAFAYEQKSSSTEIGPDGAHRDGQITTTERPLISGLLAHLKHSHESLKALLVKVNPLLILLCLAVAAGRRGRESTTLLATIVWLIFVAMVGEEFKPQLELRRLITVSAFFMTVCAAPFFIQLLEYALLRLQSPIFAERWMQRVAFVLLTGGLAFAPLTSAAAFCNQTEEKFTFAPAHLDSLTAAMREFGGSGRIFFLGFILHEMGAHSYSSQDGGHVAPLPMFVGKPMYASHFYHAKWSEVDPIPLSFRRRGAEGIEEFLDLVNATSVVTFRQEWAQYCRNNPRYQEVYAGGRFRLFVRQANPQGYFINGAGEVRADLPRRDGFAVQPATPEVVMKFRYLPNLRSDHPELAELYPVPAFEEEIGGGKTQQVDYIGLRIKNFDPNNTPWIHIGFFADGTSDRGNADIRK